LRINLTEDQLRNFATAAIAAGLAAFTLPALAAPLELVEAWQTQGLETPESVLPDPKGGFAYVSNVNGGPLDKDGNGFITKVSLKDGKILELNWAEGLNGPKGMALLGDKLYVADITQLVEIDTADGEITNAYDAVGAKFLNDVTVDAEGRIYVSDSSTSTIWRLADGNFEKWLDGPELKFPNGLHAAGDKLIIAAWGAPGTSAPSSAPANLLEVSIADKTVRDLGDGTPVGNLDGIEPLDETSYLVTDWVAGAVYRIDASGKAELLLDLPQGSADIGWVPETRLLLVPMMNDDKLVAYKVE
jgi:hypothetical protein